MTPAGRRHPFDFTLRPLVALLGVTPETDEGVAGIQGEHRHDHDQKFHGRDLTSRPGDSKAQNYGILTTSPVKPWRRQSDFQARNGFTRPVRLASFRAPAARVTGPSSTISRHESSLIPRLRQTPSRRLPSRETQRHGLRHLQIEPEVQGPPRRDRRHPPLEEGSVSGLLTSISEKRPPGRFFHARDGDVFPTDRGPAAIKPKLAMRCAAEPKPDAQFKRSEISSGASLETVPSQCEYHGASSEYTASMPNRIGSLPRGVFRKPEIVAQSAAELEQQGIHAAVGEIGHPDARRDPAARPRRRRSRRRSRACGTRR